MEEELRRHGHPVPTRVAEVTQIELFEYAGGLGFHLQQHIHAHICKLKQMHTANFKTHCHIYKSQSQRRWELDLSANHVFQSTVKKAGPDDDDRDAEGKKNLI